jgi:hypothetical protein
MSIEHLKTNLWPSIVKEIRNIAPIESSHEFMEVYLRENVPITEDCYIGPLCNMPRNPFSSKDGVVEGKMLIVQSPHKYCVIWLCRKK